MNDGVGARAKKLKEVEHNPNVKILNFPPRNKP